MDNRAMSVSTFRAVWSLASAHSHHWAMAVGEPLPADATRPVAFWLPEGDREPHPYAGLPVPPGRAEGWTPALIEALALATETGPCGGIMGPCDVYGEFTHKTASGRLEWSVIGRGESDAEVTLLVCRPVADGTDPSRSAVLIATVRRGVLSLMRPAQHPRGHEAASVEGRHVEALACALGALGIAKPLDAIREAARPLFADDEVYVERLWFACREAQAERLVCEARRLHERTLAATDDVVAGCLLWEAQCLAADLAEVSVGHVYIPLALASGAGKEGTPVERCARLASALTAALAGVLP